jgi:group I intron endonuclease
MKFSIVMEFKDLHLTGTLNSTKSAFKGLSGIYCVICTVTGAIYIGSAIELADRIIDHMLNHGSNLHLQRAITKHGLHNFTFQILEFCDITELLTREQYYLDLLFSLPKMYRYNIAPTAGSLCRNSSNKSVRLQ